MTLDDLQHPGGLSEVMKHIEIARVKGHLEGYADALEIVGDKADIETLVKALREDADVLDRCLSTQPFVRSQLAEQVKAELRSESDENTGLAGPLGEAIATVSGSYSLEFITPEQVAEGIAAWLEAEG